MQCLNRTSTLPFVINKRDRVIHPSLLFSLLLSWSNPHFLSPFYNNLTIICITLLEDTSRWMHSSLRDPSYNTIYFYSCVPAGYCQANIEITPFSSHASLSQVLRWYRAFIVCSTGDLLEVLPCFIYGYFYFFVTFYCTLSLLVFLCYCNFHLPYYVVICQILCILSTISSLIYTKDSPLSPHQQRTSTHVQELNTSYDEKVQITLC